MAKGLTDISIRNLKAGSVRREIPDPGARSLYVVVQPSGRKSFAIRYRLHGKSVKLTLTPGITLAAARKAAAVAMYEVSQGRDPAAERRMQREKAERSKADTLRSVAEEYLAREEKRLRSIGQRKRIFERFAFPVLGGGRPIGDIRRKDIVRLLDHIEDKHGARMADYSLACLSRLFNWFAARDDEFISPIVRGMKRQKPGEHARQRVLTDDELCRVWRTAETWDGPFGAFVRFLLLTSARRSEAAQMTWSEIDGTDWLLPASRNKAKHDLLRPLSGAAMAILDTLPRFAGSDLVFTNNGRQPFGNVSEVKARFDKACGIVGYTIHDLRRTSRSLLSRANVVPDHAERCLGHVVGGVRGVYDRHEFYKEKKVAFEKLAAQIERIINPPEGEVADMAAERSKRRR
jgi:integrase